MAHQDPKQLEGLLGLVTGKCTDVQKIKHCMKTTVTLHCGHRRAAYILWTCTAPNEDRASVACFARVACLARLARLAAGCAKVLRAR